MNEFSNDEDCQLFIFELIFSTSKNEINQRGHSLFVIAR